MGGKRRPRGLVDATLVDVAVEYAAIPAAYLRLARAMAVTCPLPEQDDAQCTDCLLHHWLCPRPVQQAQEQQRVDVDGR